MDFYAEDDKGRVFDVEMQKRNRGKLESSYVEKVITLLREDSDRTDEQAAELLLYGKEE